MKMRKRKRKSLQYKRNVKRNTKYIQDKSINMIKVLARKSEKYRKKEKRKKEDRMKCEKKYGEFYDKLLKHIMIR